MCVSCLAERLYQVMNSLDCGCTTNRQETVSLPNGNYVQFVAHEHYGHFVMLIIKDGVGILNTIEVDFAEPSTGGSATIEMFRKMLLTVEGLK